MELPVRKPGVLVLTIITLTIIIIAGHGRLGGMVTGGIEDIKESACGTLSLLCDDSDASLGDGMMQDRDAVDGSLGSIRGNTLSSEMQDKLQSSSSYQGKVSDELQTTLERLEETETSMGTSLLQVVFRESEDESINPLVVIAIITTESTGKVDATNSNSGTAGLMQLKACTARDMGLDVANENYEMDGDRCRNIEGDPESRGDERFNGRLNIITGIAYLDWIGDTLQTSQPDRIIAAYHSGVGAIGDTPKEEWDSDTNDYLEKVRGYIRELQQLDPGTEVRDLPDFTAEEHETGEVVDRKGAFALPSGSISASRIVLHHTGGGEEFDINTLERVLRERELSVHYGLSRNGVFTKYAEHNQLAYHACGANSDTIGIEIVNSGKEPFTDAQYEALNQLLPRLVENLNGEKNPKVIGHFEVGEYYDINDCSQGKWDPHPSFNWDKIGYERQKDMDHLADLCSRVKDDSELNYQLECYASDQGFFG